MELRVGQGIDVHRFAKDRKLILGGVHIPSDFGLIGHSDADILIHAIVDAILGACGKSDIGTYFPSEDPQWKNADSSIFLKEAIRMLNSDGWKLVNVDCNILMEAPKLLPHISKIKENLSRIIGIAIDQLSIKAGTMEKMGFVGNGEGAMATAVVLIQR